MQLLEQHAQSSMFNRNNRDRAPERWYVTQLLRASLKRGKEDGYCSCIMQVVYWPLNKLRDYTIPMSSEEDWDKTRAIILPPLICISFMYLFGDFNDLTDPNASDDDKQGDLKMLYISLIVGACSLVASLLIYCYTTKTTTNNYVLLPFAIIAFVQSIAWINFASNSIVDLLKLFGFITRMPQSLLSLTVLAWGNCLGDMTADVVMTKKGFGEMAVTATVAGPIFNVLIGQGVSNLFALLANKDFPLTEVYVSFTLKNDDGSFDQQAMLPLVLLAMSVIFSIVILVNAIMNKFKVGFRLAIMSVIVYVAGLVYLVVYCYTNNVAAPSDS